MIEIYFSHLWRLESETRETQGAKTGKWGYSSGFQIVYLLDRTFKNAIILAASIKDKKQCPCFPSVKEGKFNHAVTRTGSHGNYKGALNGRELYLKLENKCKGITYYVFQAFKNGDLKHSDHQPRFVVEYSSQTWDVCKSTMRKIGTIL